MKIEVVCSACRRGYLVDEASIPITGGQVPCLHCGSMIDVRPEDLLADATPPPSTPPPWTPPSPEPEPEPERRSYPTPPHRAAGSVRATSTANAPVAPPRIAATTRSAPAELPEGRPAAPAVPASEVVCPRCGLHFVPKAKHAPAQGVVRPTALVVEDMAYFREIARDALRQEFEVRTVGTVPDAVATVREGGIDLLVLDLNLEGDAPGESLLDLLQPKPCPILIFTAEDEAEMYGDKWDTLRARGADDLVLKGMHVGEQLRKKAAELLGLELDDDVEDD